MDVSPPRRPLRNRSSGLLLHVTSLPAPYGIGDYGPTAFRWVDILAEAGQQWWQLLPLGPTGGGASPYQLTSAFAGNPLLISPDLLAAEGLLDQSDLELKPPSQSHVDYDAAARFKQLILEKAWNRFLKSGSAELANDLERFEHEQQAWLEDYALFESLRQACGTSNFQAWPRQVAHREPAALDDARKQFAGLIRQIRFGQFLAFRQLTKLREYARGKGIRLIGDLPFFAAPESADVWANPHFFQLDEDLRPRFVAGVPPDYFSPTGQLWGNPVYSWDALKQTGYDWWLRRIRTLLQQVDLIRLDHFRGFAAAWHVPAAAKSALDGEWRPGPGADFFIAVRDALGELPFLAEDLGEITPDVIELRDQFGLPGMRVMQFGFEGNSDNPFLPENYPHDSVAYTATHDNDTTRGWYEALDPDEQRRVRRYLRRRHLKPDQAAAEMVHRVWQSKSRVAIAPLQDILNLGTEHRMNTPGTAEGNWTWRCGPEILTESDIHWLRSMTEETDRNRRPVFARQ